MSTPDNDRAASVAALLREAAATHHRVYRISGGEDPDWASWYADWLAKLSELPQLLGSTPVRSELVYLLVSLDRDYNREPRSETWDVFYTQGLLEHFKTGS